MRRYLAAGVLFAVAVGLLALSGRGEAQGNQWTTIKGRVVWGGTKIPEPKRITVTVDKDHCLSANKTAAKDGTILDETLLVNPKTKGLKNVFVYILVDPDAKIPINPKLANFAPQVKLDQPACAFFPHALVLREGQTLVVQNTAPVQHNIRWI